jgi:membrane-associated protease RseP (regulator of RpoE activity)
MGAVIGMDGSRVNRRQVFDLGIAGPLAGFAVTLPLLWLGIQRLPNPPLPGQSFCFHSPWLVQHLIAWIRPDYPTPDAIYLSQFNPFLMAGWVGLLVTGLNMLPVSMLDGGHVAYALLGRRGHWLARGLIVAAILYIIFAAKYFWILFLVLVILLGADHPPTADDGCRLGWFRRLLGWASLLLPFLCLSAAGITPM